MLGRSAAAIVRKVGNLASFDPQMKARGVGGLGHTGKLDEVVWNRYFGQGINIIALSVPGKDKLKAWTDKGYEVTTFFS